MIDATTIHSQLQLLEQLKQKTQALVEVKSTLISKTSQLDHKKSLLEKAHSERQRLNKEKKILLDMLQNIQRDLDLAVGVEKSLTKEHQELELNVDRFKKEHYEPIQDEVNAIRVQSGMDRLPHIQQELEAQMAE
ncbi:hypothetical protein BY458DRAFT_556949 [Sporodiniella umbellata]|nr:hypothetical protein BY458DRAFT_556949 [Sporodiniella umbellata]